MSGVSSNEAGPRHPWPLALRVAIICLCVAVLAASCALTFVGRSWQIFAEIGVAVSSLALGPLIAWFFGARPRPAMSRYLRRLIVTMSIYMVTLYGGLALYQRGLTAGPLGYLVAIAAAAPIVGVFVVVGLFVKEEADELIRKVVLESVMWGGVVTLAEATVWGFLEMFGKAPHVWMWVATAAFIAQSGLASAYIWRKYR
jgi:hypothetical protein